MKGKCSLFLIASSTLVFSACDFSGQNQLDATSVAIQKKFELKGSTGETIKLRQSFLQDEEVPVTIPGVTFKGSNDLCKGSEGPKAYESLMLMTDTALLSGQLVVDAFEGKITMTAEMKTKLAQLPPCVVSDKGSWANDVRPLLRTINYLFSTTEYVHAEVEDATMYVPQGSSNLAIALNFRKLDWWLCDDV